jgi:hypothetical protein
MSGGGPKRVVWGLALLVGFALLLVAPAAGALDGALPEEDFTATYSGTLDVTGEGATSAEATMVITCREGQCAAELPGGFAGGQLEFAQSATITYPFGQTVVVERDPGCLPGGIRHLAEGELRADADSVAVSYSLPSYVYECEDGSRASSGAVQVSFQAALTEVDAGAAPPDMAAPGATGSGSAGGSGTSVSDLKSGSSGAPSVLSATPRVQDVELTGGRSLALVALVVVLVLLIAFPTHLLNNAVESGQDKLSRWSRRRRGLAEDTNPGPVSSARTWGVAAAVVLAASLIGAFVDPDFGLNPGSVRVVAALFLALAVESVLVWFLVIVLTRRTSPGTVAGFRAAPATLLVVAVAVLLTRLTGFEPGIVFGLVAGVTFAAATTTAAEGKVALAGAALGFGLALLGWGGYSLLGTTTDEGFWRAFASDTLSSLAVAGIASMPLALVPLRGLPGHTLWSWRKPVWAGSYALGLIGFFVVLMPMPFSWEAVDTPLRTWVLLYLAYAGAAVMAWAVITQPWRRKELSDPA